jgi:hypothetical protein
MRKERGPFHCVKCGQEKTGRFCNVIISGFGWTQRTDHVQWYCWDCYPWGTAKRPAETDEAEMPPSAREAQRRQQGAA